MLLYADENFPIRVVEELRKRGHDVLTAYDDGRGNRSIPDSEILARTTVLGRAVMTLDRADFKRLHRENPNHSGIVICTEDPDRIRQAALISNAIETAGNVTGQLIRVYRPS